MALPTECKPSLYELEMNAVPTQSYPQGNIMLDNHQLSLDSQLNLVCIKFTIKTNYNTILNVGSTILWAGDLDSIKSRMLAV